MGKFAAFQILSVLHKLCNYLAGIRHAKAAIHEPQMPPEALS